MRTTKQSSFCTVPTHGVATGAGKLSPAAAGCGASAATPMCAKIAFEPAVTAHLLHRAAAGRVATATRGVAAR
jgi:hypothetical protein